MKRYFSPLDAAVDSLNSITQQQAAWARRLDQRHQLEHILRLLAPNSIRG